MIACTIWQAVGVGLLFGVAGMFFGSYVTAAGALEERERLMDWWLEELRRLSRDREES